MQDILLIGFYAVLGFAFILIWIWMAGRMATMKRRNRIAQYISPRFSDITSKISVKLLGNTGAKLAYHQEEKSYFSKLEATILLLDRSNPFAMIYWKIRHRTDQLQIRTNLRKPPFLQVELTTHKERARLDKHLVERRDKPQELEIDYLNDQFYVVSYTPKEAKSFFKQPKLRKAFEEVSPYLTRLSIARKEPHLFFSVMLVPEAIPSMERFTQTLGQAQLTMKKNT